jgi:hypothetical protein
MPGGSSVLPRLWWNDLGSGRILKKIAGSSPGSVSLDDHPQQLLCHVSTNFVRFLRP